MEKETDLKFNGRIVGQFIASENEKENAKKAINLLKEKGLYNKSSSLERILRQALSFEKATVILYKISDEVTVPFVVNGTFCIELLLKSLHESLKSQPKGHDLFELYKKLPDNIKMSISEKFEAEKDSFIFDSFENTLFNLRKTFVEWRYLHEKIETSIISKNIILKIILVLKRELSVYCKELEDFNLKK